VEPTGEAVVVLVAVVVGLLLLSCDRLPTAVGFLLGALVVGR
jgi:Na+/H+-translocating membrane pyrophosphatase